MKIARHAEIIKLINQYAIETQEELAARLNENGFSVTQATVSRDIRQLNLTKMPTENGHFRYVLMQKKDQNLSEKYARVLKDAVLSMDVAQNILVIKTVSGMAMASAAVLDAMEIHGMVGTIAGDDTIMCVMKDKNIGKTVMTEIEKMMKNAER